MFVNPTAQQENQLHQHSFPIIVTVEYGNVGCFSVSSPLQACNARATKVELCACVDFGIPRREVRSGPAQKNPFIKKHQLEIALLQAWSAQASRAAWRTFFPAAAAAAQPQRCTDSA